MVTSPGPSEGKSTTAANLAIAMAQAGHQTVLVDVDLRRPVQAKTFGVMNSVGLTTAIADRTVPLFELFHATDIDNLTLLGSGQLPPNPSELVGSQRMKEIVRELESLFDVVILDSPPVLMVSDSSLLATHVDGIILVVRESETTVEAAYRAAEQIRSVKARLLGTVLNGVKQRGQGYNYYYYNQYYGGGKGQPRSSGQPVR